MWVWFCVMVFVVVVGLISVVVMVAFCFVVWGWFRVGFWFLPVWFFGCVGCLVTCCTCDFELWFWVFGVWVLTDYILVIVLFASFVIDTLLLVW